MPNAATVQVRIQLSPSTGSGYQVATLEPWNKKQPIIISRDAAPVISFPMKNPGGYFRGVDLVLTALSRKFQGSPSASTDSMSQQTEFHEIPLPRSRPLAQRLYRPEFYRNKLVAEVFQIILFQTLHALKWNRH